MTDPEGRRCPECGAPRDADNTPSCACARRAAEALLETRTAEAAAAEDFDPLRIRPYVELEGADAGATMPLRTVRPEEPARDATSVPPTPAEGGPSTQDLRLFEAERTEGEPGDGVERPRGRRRTVLLGAAGAVVAVVAAAGLASGLFSYEPPSRDGALPQDVRASVPDASPSTASVTPSGRAAPVRPSAAPTPSVSPSASASPTPSTTPSPAPTPSRSPKPATTPPTVTATGTVGAPNAQPNTQPPVLRRGSEGPEVTELEQRLTQLGFYTRTPTGHYNEGVEDAVTRYQKARGLNVPEYGVYDLVTRAHLESETTEP
ncbi:peptidoglycan-binding domain-containing protein [Streptomyces gilvus]|uniref:peptidoglycan-binding domain-containing protein n=1 Tax=Streptomyces gilvus TaxID=2920937 RepID=UPI001F0E481F|nr:peptidoglycan-binding domain-containing protein [Streptomyces sp. CME 23]MCH5677057.1 peptidoglycan-binding protein [Streptomyces sp. CME 23]